MIECQPHHGALLGWQGSRSARGRPRRRREARGEARKCVGRARENGLLRRRGELGAFKGVFLWIDLMCYVVGDAEDLCRQAVRCGFGRLGALPDHHHHVVEHSLSPPTPPLPKLLRQVALQPGGTAPIERFQRLTILAPCAGSGRGCPLPLRPVVTSSVGTERRETSTHRRTPRVAVVVQYIPRPPPQGFNRVLPRAPQRLNLVEQPFTDRGRARAEAKTH